MMPRRIGLWKFMMRMGLCKAIQLVRFFKIKKAIYGCLSMLEYMTMSCATIQSPTKPLNYPWNHNWLICRYMELIISSWRQMTHFGLHHRELRQLTGK